MEIMIIEDNRSLREEMQTFFNARGYQVRALTDFTDITGQIFTRPPDIILLDLGLPGIDGQIILQRIREKLSLPVIVVTSRDSEMDELISLQLADDFITKPFHPQILLARVQSVLRRSGRSPEEERLQWGVVHLWLTKSQLEYQDQWIDLTVNELRILSVLFKNGDTISSRDELMNALWQSGDFVDDNTLSVNVNRLRQKLAQIGLTEFIHTKRSQGYSL